MRSFRCSTWNTMDLRRQRTKNDLHDQPHFFTPWQRLLKYGCSLLILIATCCLFFPDNVQLTSTEPLYNSIFRC